MASTNNITVKNIYDYPKSGNIIVDTLFENPIIKLERVVAQGQASPPGVFCPQTDNDILFQLKGELGLEYQASGKDVNLTVGGYVVSTPNENNRVASTSLDSVWLKVNFYGNIAEGLYPSPDLAAIKKSMQQNIYTNTALIESLIETNEVRVERVASRGQASQAGATCPQDDTEFLVLLKGETVLEIENEKVNLTPGDYVFIPPNTENRVDLTSTKDETVWLAVYFNASQTGNYPFSTGY